MEVNARPRDCCVGPSIGIVRREQTIEVIQISCVSDHPTSGQGVLANMLLLDVPTGFSIVVIETPVDDLKAIRGCRWAVEVRTSVGVPMLVSPAIKKTRVAMSLYMFCFCGEEAASGSSSPSVYRSVRARVEKPPPPLST